MSVMTRHRPEEPAWVFRMLLGPVTTQQLTGERLFARRSPGISFYAHRVRFPMTIFFCPECRSVLRPAAKSMGFSCDKCLSFFCIVRLPLHLVMEQQIETTQALFNQVSVRMDDHYAELMKQIDEVQP
jgi:hypothetical protein